MAQEIKTLSSAALAFLGDAVYELYIRDMVVHQREGNADQLNHLSKALTNARAQAHLADLLQTSMTAEELAVYKRGRNMKSLSTPKSCTISEYRRATGLEALMGYLHFHHRPERIRELLNLGISSIEQESV